MLHFGVEMGWVKRCGTLRALYHIFARRPGNGMENAHARTLFRKVVNTSATADIEPEEIVVSLGGRADNPLLIAAGFVERRQPIPWLKDRRLRIRFF
ncbi:MAG: hypothetical protein OXH79_09135 [Boseongicola sp.]|nr:hypothetical protein [Boseongicola sp.]